MTSLTTDTTQTTITALGAPLVSRAHWTHAVETPDLLAVFRALQRQASTAPEPHATVDDLLAWAMRQEFEPDHVERLRREAWGAAGSE